MDPLNLNKTAETLTKAVPEVTGAVDRVGDKIQATAESLSEAVKSLEGQASIDAAQIVGSILAESQAWREELAKWREMVAPLAAGIKIIPIQENQQ